MCVLAVHEFSPQGICGVVILAESHLSIHSSPERGYASIDIYTCGRYVQPKLAILHLDYSLESNNNNCREIIRGVKSRNL
ncbi:adenosylmethionine decarboxylase [Gracilibacillus suaedae]|uniref:adenosylmethionine decarboxylase n=1 Tax=Gracilibacillus suaedae TaxID=2820273 RepID=UPI001ABDD368